MILFCPRSASRDLQSSAILESSNDHISGTGGMWTDFVWTSTGQQSFAISLEQFAINFAEHPFFVGSVQASKVS